MADTIEAFVAKLQAEGVRAGEEEAERIKAEARRQAEEVVRQAEARAGKIVEEAQAQAATALAKGRTELELAARDTVARLRDTLGRILKVVLLRETEGVLSDEPFLRQLIHDIVMQYAQADVAQGGAIRINVPRELQRQFADWILKELVHKTGGISIDLQATLAEAGFEYRVEGATVEVTRTSVAEALAELVSPAIRGMLDQAMAAQRE